MKDKTTWHQIINLLNKGFNNGEILNTSINKALLSFSLGQSTCSCILCEKIALRYHNYDLDAEIFGAVYRFLDNNQSEKP